MVYLGPVAPPYPEVPRELADDDLAWVNEQLEMVGCEHARRAYPVIPMRPDPELSQVVYR